MSQDNTKNPTPSSPANPDHPPGVRFRQIFGKLAVDGILDEQSRLVALSEEGVPYSFEWNEEASTYIWSRMPVVSSTDLAQGECEICRATSVFLPGSGFPVRCRHHRYAP